MSNTNHSGLHFDGGSATTDGWTYTVTRNPKHDRRPENWRRWDAVATHADGRVVRVCTSTNIMDAIVSCNRLAETLAAVARRDADATT